MSIVEGENKLSYRVVIRRMIDRVLLKIHFTLSAFIIFFVLFALLFSAYVSNPQYQTAEHLISLVSWLLLSLAYILGSLVERLKPRSRIPWLLAIASSLISMLLFTLWFALTLEPPYVVQLLTLGWQFYFIPCVIYSLVRIKP